MALVVSSCLGLAGGAGWGCEQTEDDLATAGALFGLFGQLVVVGIDMVVGEMERLEAVARRSKELAVAVRREPDPVEREAWERVRAEMPGASRLEQARAVVARVAEGRSGVGEVAL